MSIITWILLGLIAGFIAGKIVNRTGSGIFVDILAGILGAVIGGFVFERFGTEGVTGFNIWSLIVAVVGAIILLFVVNLFRRA